MTHEHGPDCTCGCREHDHEHEHAHAHDHEHHHGHAETVDFVWGHVELEAHTHEQAATVSMHIHPSGGFAIAFSNLIDVMQTIASEAKDAGGIVGHIKAFAKQGDAFVRASVTAAHLPPTCDGDQFLALDATAEVQLVAIVLLIDQTTLLAICKEALMSPT